MTQTKPTLTVWLVATLLFLQAACAAGGEQDEPAVAADSGPLTLPPPKPGRDRHLVAVVADNAGTEVTDFVVPFGVLKESGAADVVPVATASGPVTLLPALKLHVDDTLAGFDARHPDGADVVVVPALHRVDSPAVVSWLQRQWQSGAVVVGICDGVLTVAHAGFLQERRATGHWYSLDALRRDHPDTVWISDRRYVADGRAITTTGVTASIPVSLALVEAMGGEALAEQTAARLGVAVHGPEHDSAAFGLSARLIATALINGARFWSRETVALPVDDGTDEIALALTADAWSRTYRSTAVAVHEAKSQIRSRRGLVFEVDAAAGPGEVTLTVRDRLPARALDEALAEIAGRYGLRTAEFVALQLEYDLTAAR